MAKQLVAVFLMCMVVVAAMHVPKAEATSDQQFSECYHACHKECFQDGKVSYTYCEMKCNDDCNTKEIKLI